MSDTQRRVMFSKKEGRTIGSYEYRLALVYTTASDEAVELLENPSLVRRHDGDTETILRLLLEATSDIHERRHYVDNFGTLSGITMFATQMRSIERFLDACRQLMRERRAWQLPLSAWVRQADCPAVIRGLRQYAQAESLSLDVFNGNFGRTSEPGHRSEWWVDVPVDMPAGTAALGKPMVVPAFPVSFSTGESEASVQAGKVVAMTTVYVPLGFETLMEGTAHSLARTFVDDFFPDVAKDVLVKYGPPLRLKASLDETERERLIREHIKPYNITDLMISKALRAQGIPEFQRSLVLKLSDIALSRGMLKLEQRNEALAYCEVANPARELIDALAKADPDQLRDDSLTYPDTIRILYQSMLANYRQLGAWDQIDQPHHDHMAIHVWSHFLAQHVIVPLLERRLASDHALFYDADQSIKQLLDRELPMVMVRNEQMLFQNIPDEVGSAWWKQMMQGEVAAQVLNDAELIRCPRAHEMLPGMKSVNLSKGDCNRNKRCGCGSWQQGRANVLPDCLFTSTLQTLGFVPLPQRTPATFSERVETGEPAGAHDA